MSEDYDSLASLEAFADRISQGELHYDCEADHVREDQYLEAVIRWIAANDPPRTDDGKRRVAAALKILDSERGKYYA